MKTFSDLSEGLFSSEFKKQLKQIGASIIQSDSDMGFKSYWIKLNGKEFKVTKELSPKRGEKQEYSVVHAGKGLGKITDLSVLKTL